MLPVAGKVRDLGCLCFSVSNEMIIRDDMYNAHVLTDVQITVDTDNLIAISSYTFDMPDVIPSCRLQCDISKIFPRCKYEES